MFIIEKNYKSKIHSFTQLFLTHFALLEIFIFGIQCAHLWIIY
jgi:hypothetical protein